jgi:hypothetical protein
MKLWLCSIKFGWKLFFNSIFHPKQFVASMKMYDIAEQKHEKLINLSEMDIFNICLSYRHDYGLLTAEEQHTLQFECKEWARAIYNNKLLDGKKVREILGNIGKKK